MMRMVQLLTMPGLVEMGDLGDEALRITDELDSAGNTVKQ